MDEYARLRLYIAMMQNITTYNNATTQNAIDSDTE